MTVIADEVQQQRGYYARTAQSYEDLHVRHDDEHQLALAWLVALIEHCEFRSVLDIGAGTGRCQRYLKARLPGLKVTGIEPSAALRGVGHAAGLGADELRDGDATRLLFADGSFDLVCEFGVLHHIRQPRRAIAEMLRVARGGIFISDDNHLACGSGPARAAKRLLNRLGLWHAAYRLRTGGKGYRISDSDGLSYPYSVFDDLRFVEAHCAAVHLANTTGSGADPRRTASHVALFGRKAAGNSGRSSPVAPS